MRVKRKNRVWWLVMVVLCFGVGMSWGQANKEITLQKSSPTVSEEDYTYELVDVRPLTPAGMYATFPQWSPDGKKIMFTLEKGYYVHVTDLETGETKAVSQPDEGLPMLWSPDSKKVFFYRVKDEGADFVKGGRKARCWGIVADIEKVTRKEFDSPVKKGRFLRWDADDGIVAENEVEEKRDKEFRSLDETGNVRALKKKIKIKDTDIITYVEPRGGGEVYIAAADGSWKKKIAGGKLIRTETVKFSNAPSYTVDLKEEYFKSILSPDKKKIYAIGCGNILFYPARIFDLNGNILYEFHPPKFSPPDDKGSWGWNDYAGSWMQDSRHLLVPWHEEIAEDESYPYSKAELFLIDIVNKTAVQITNTTDLAENSVLPSPNGKYILFKDERYPDHTYKGKFYPGRKDSGRLWVGELKRKIKQ